MFWSAMWMFGSVTRVFGGATRHATSLQRPVPPPESSSRPSKRDAARHVATNAPAHRPAAQTRPAPLPAPFLSLPLPKIHYDA